MTLTRRGRDPRAYKACPQCDRGLARDDGKWICFVHGEVADAMNTRPPMGVELATPMAASAKARPSSPSTTKEEPVAQTFKCAECLREGLPVDGQAFGSIEELDAHLAESHPSDPPECEARIDALTTRVNALADRLAVLEEKAVELVRDVVAVVPTPPTDEVTVRLDAMQQEIDSGWDAIAGLQSWHSEMTELSIRYMGELVDAAPKMLSSEAFLDRIEKRLFWNQP